MEDKNKIGDFFRNHLSDYKEEVSLMDLEMMSTRMSRSNFLKFNVRHFNVYYAAAIFSGFLVSLSLGGHYILTFKKQNEVLMKTKTELAQLKELIKNNEVTQTSKLYISNLPNSPIQSKKSSYSGGEMLTQPSTHLYVSNKKMDVKKKENTSQSIILNESTIESKEHHESDVPNLLNEGGNTGLTELQNLNTAVEDTTVKKKIVIYRRDTIFEYDTLKVKKKRK